MAKSKRIRLLTNRDFPGAEDAFEFIEMEEVDGKQYLYQRMGETSLGTKAEGCFPISVDLVQDRFQELGRSYVPTGKEVAKTVKDLMVR